MDKKLVINWKYTYFFLFMIFAPVESEEGRPDTIFGEGGLLEEIR